MESSVTRNDLAGRYELTVDDRVVGVADFRVEGDRVVMPHTVIDPARRGQGLAAVLVAAALEDIRQAGRTVVPACWYVAQYLDAHPEQADLIAD